MKSAPTTIDAYVAGFPEDVQPVLRRMREVIRRAAPGATEAMKYGVPTFVLDGNLVHFGGFQRHVGFYPGPSGIAAFQAELSGYEGAKGSVRFPLDRPLPVKLIEKIVRFRVEEQAQLAARRVKKAPAARKSAPATEKRAPAAKENALARKAPAARKGAPAAGKAPAAKKTAPAAGKRGRRPRGGGS